MAVQDFAALFEGGEGFGETVQAEIGGDQALVEVFGEGFGFYAKAVVADGGFVVAFLGQEGAGLADELEISAADAFAGSDGPGLVIVGV